MDRQREVGAAMSLMAANEAVHAVALSHAENCTCLTCKAAGGDQEAMTEVMAALVEQQQP